MSEHEPDRFELQLLGIKGRLNRLMREEGLSLFEALSRITNPETAEEYVGRNTRALDDVTERVLSPEYLARFQEAYNEPDLALREKKLADLTRENHEHLDIEALHRVVRARNRQMKAEGILPPEAPV